jgi:hypothetical protein
VISSGLLESAIRDVADRTLALTLFRGTRRTVNTDGEPNGQLRGELAFRYWLVPLAGPPDRTRLSRLGQQIAAGVRAVQVRPADVPLFRQAKVLPPTAGLLQVDGPAVVTSARWVGDGLEVRLFNPTAAAGEARLRFGAGLRFSTLQAVDFESKPIEAVHILGQNDGSVQLAAKQIKTIRCM